MILAVPGAASAAEAVPVPVPDLPAGSYSLIVSFTKDDGNVKLDGADIGIRKIAGLTVKNGLAAYRMLDTYSQYASDEKVFDGMTAAESEKLAAAIAGKNSKGESSQKTDSSGKAVFTGLEAGMYLVTEDSKSGTAAGYESFEPFLVSVPEAVKDTEGNVTWKAEAEAEPKTTVAKIETPKKEKNTGNNTGTSQKRTVTSAQTSDDSGIQWWGIILAAASLALVPAIIYEKRRRENRKA